MKNLRKTISDNLARFMGQKQINKNKLSKLSCVSGHHIRKILKQESSPKLDTLAALADALEVGIVELVIDQSGNKGMILSMLDELPANDFEEGLQVTFNKRTIFVPRSNEP